MGSLQHTLALRIRGLCTEISLLESVKFSPVALEIFDSLDSSSADASSDEYSTDSECEQQTIAASATGPFYSDSIWTVRWSLPLEVEECIVRLNVGGKMIEHCERDESEWIWSCRGECSLADSRGRLAVGLKVILPGQPLIEMRFTLISTVGRSAFWRGLKIKLGPRIRGIIEQPKTSLAVVPESAKILPPNSNRAGRNRKRMSAELVSIEPNLSPVLEASEPPESPKPKRARLQAESNDQLVAAQTYNKIYRDTPKAQLRHKLEIKLRQSETSVCTELQDLLSRNKLLKTGIEKSFELGKHFQQTVEIILARLPVPAVINHFDDQLKQTNLSAAHRIELALARQLARKTLEEGIQPALEYELREILSVP